VHDNQIKIKSCHKNPIYFSKTGSDSKDILYQDGEIDLDNNDFFSLLPNECEFQIKIDINNEDNNQAASFRVREVTEINDNLEAGAMPVSLSQVLRDTDVAQPQVSSSSSSTRKRSIESESTNELPKKIKTEPKDESESNTASTSTASTTNSPNKVQIKPDPDSTNEAPSTTSNVKQEPDSSDTQSAPNVRQSCEHGIRCFRHNPEHRRDQAHPGDNDYRRPEFPPAAPNAPRCPYWAACYRRNPDHFRMFEHPPSCKFCLILILYFNLEISL
jgi:aprataxin and PNK-like factor